MNERGQLRTIVFGAEGAMGKRLVSTLKASRPVVALDQAVEPWLKLDSCGGGSGGCDITDRDQIKTLLAQIGAPLGGIVYLPRVKFRRTFLETQLDELLHEFSVVVGGFVSTLQVLLEMHEDRPTRSLSVVAMSSVLGSRISGFEGVGYHLSKASLEQTVRLSSRAAGPAGCRVNAVAPGWLIDDEESLLDFPEHVQRALKFIHPMRCPTTYSQLFDLVEFLLSEKSSCLTGQVLFADGGVQSLEPSFTAIKEKW